jgi:hypothetical protein
MLKRNMSEKLKQETQQLNLSDGNDIARLEHNAKLLLEYHYQWMQLFDKQGYCGIYRA